MYAHIQCANNKWGTLEEGRRTVIKMQFVNIPSYYTYIVRRWALSLSLSGWIGRMEVISVVI